jgi:hypothetical protein
MGYAIVKGRYHKGPKKATRKRRVNKPTFDKPTPQKPSALTASEESLVKVLATLDDAEMSKFIGATTYPNPKDVVVGVGRGNGTPTVTVLDDDDDLQTNSGMVYVAGLGGGCGGGFGGGLSTFRGELPKPKGVVPNKTPTIPKEIEGEVVGFIIKKPNGEMVLKFK